MVTEPSTGDGGYMLAGGIAGGVASWDTTESSAPSGQPSSAEGSEMGMWVLLSTVLGTGNVFGQLLNPVWAVVTLEMSVASIGFSIGATLNVINCMAPGAKREALSAKLYAGAVLALASLAAITVASVSAAVATAPSVMLSPFFGLAMAASSLVVSMMFWTWTVWLRQEAEMG